MNESKDLGLSFAPTGQNSMGRRQGQQSTPIQQAIKTVSLRIPRFAGGGPQGAGAPNALMNSPGGAGLSGQMGPGGMQGPQGMNLMQFLQQLLGPQIGQQGQGGMMGGPMGGGANPFTLNPSATIPNVNFGTNPNQGGAQQGPQMPVSGMGTTETGLPEWPGSNGPTEEMQGTQQLPYEGPFWGESGMGSFQGNLGEFFNSLGKPAPGRYTR